MNSSKPRGLNGTVIFMYSWKAVSRQGRPNREHIIAKVDTLGEKVVQRMPLLNLENRKWHQHPTFYNRSALGPSKNGSRGRFLIFYKNTMKFRSDNDRF